MDATQNNMACEPLAAVLMDLRAWDRELYQDLEPSLKMVQDRTRSRGVVELLVLLPKAGKHLDKCLSGGELDLSNYPSELPTRAQFPILFGPLYRRIFLNNLHESSSFPILAEEDISNEIFFLRTLLYMYKSVEVPCPTENIEKAVKAFSDIDVGLRNPSIIWDSPDFFDITVGRAGSLSFTDSVLIGSDSYRALALMKNLDKVADILVSHMPMIDTLSLLPRHGPGAVADARSDQDKYLLPNWSKSSHRIFPREYFAYSTEEWAASDPHYEITESYNQLGKLTAVPKDYTKPRLITVEPTSHQFLQQGLLRWFRTNLPRPLRHCISFRSQDPSRDSARRASIRGSGMATVDLSSASDRMSLWAVERAFKRTDILSHLQGCRTSTIFDGTKPNSSMGELVLRKFAGQGSAVTFPIQSILYAICCITAVLTYDGSRITTRNITKAAKKVRVFGDDIVIPCTALPDLSLIFNKLQLKINSEKTHWRGCFRESCGGDYFRGVDVTPFYLKTLFQVNTIAEICSTVDVSNNAYIKGLWNLSTLLSSRIPAKYSRMIPVSDTPQGGLTLRTHIRGTFARQTRYHWDWQVERIKTLQVFPKVRTVQREASQDLLSFFTEGAFRRPIEYVPWDSGYTVTGPLKYRTRWVPIQ